MTAPRADSPIERVLARLKGVRPNGPGRWMAKCPAHEDGKASLSLRVGKEQRALMYCHAGCTFAAIVAAVGLSSTDVFADDRPLTVAAGQAPAQGVTSRQRMVKSYDYTDADGTLLYQTCRFEPKDFKPRVPDGRGGWRPWGLHGIETVLYRLPEVIAAVAESRRVFLVEGEKDADALAAWGHVATTVSGGAKNWRPRHASVLAGATVVILPDNDDAGRSYAQQAAADLVAAGCTVRVVPLPDLPPKGDVSDWLAAGGDFDDLDDLIARTPRVSADPSQAKRRTRWRLDELLENDAIMRPPPPIVPYLAWSSRSTLLAAREKSGKSTLTGYMAACVSTGRDFLDEPCDIGTVLIIGLEEYIGDTARRLRDFEADRMRVELVDCFANPPEERLSEIKQHIIETKPSLVILDSLIAYSAGVITDANNSTQTQATVQALTDLCHETGVALVIIHHARKSDGKYRDSSAIGGSVDFIAEVLTPDEAADPTRRRVRAIGRGPARGVDFRFDGGRYTRVDAEGPMKAPLEQRILDVVRERPGIGANDVSQTVNENRKTVLERLKLMINQRTLINDGDGNYYRLRLPNFPPRLGTL